MIVNCRQCNISFDKSLTNIKKTKNNFCSRSCAATFNNLGRVRNPRVPRTCKKCTKTYFRSKNFRSEYCRECYTSPTERKSKWINMTLNECHNILSVKGKHPSWVNARVRQYCRTWNDDLLKLPCQVCNYNLHIELCHIKPVSSFEESATLGEVNKPDNILVLCRNHHWEFDNGIISLSDIPTR